MNDPVAIPDTGVPSYDVFILGDLDASYLQPAQQDRRPVKPMRRKPGGSPAAFFRDAPGIL